MQRRSESHSDSAWQAWDLGTAFPRAVRRRRIPHDKRQPTKQCNISGILQCLFFHHSAPGRDPRTGYGLPDSVDDTKTEDLILPQHRHVAGANQTKRCESSLSRKCQVNFVSRSLVLIRKSAISVPALLTAHQLEVEASLCLLQTDRRNMYLSQRLD